MTSYVVGRMDLRMVLMFGFEAQWYKLTIKVKESKEVMSRGGVVGEGW